MKKSLAIILAFMMMLALAMPTLAAGGSASASASGSSTVDVNGEFVSAADPATVISVDIEWEGLRFTYNAASAGTWNSVTHTYDGKHDAYWSDNKAEITVTNHSNSYVEAKFSFAASKTGLKGVFYEQNAVNSFTALTDTALYLATAVGTSSTNPPTGKIFFGMDSASVGITESEAQSSIGTIMIGIKKGAPRMTVGTEAELNAAIAALKTTGGTITLTSDLTLTDPITIPEGAGTSTSPLIIDLGGKTVIGRIAIGGTSTSRSYVTLRNGELDYVVGTDDTTLRNNDPTQAAVYAEYTDLKLEGIYIYASQLALRTSTGTKTLIEGGEEKDACIRGGFLSNSYYLSIYNTSSEDFILSNTGNYGFTIDGYIVSNYNLTLKANSNYIFEDVQDGIVEISTGEDDKNTGAWEKFPNINGQYQTRIVILTTDYVTTE